MLGEQHPHTATSFDNVAACLNGQGKHAEAARHWQKALLGHECGRLQASRSGFDRALFRADRHSPRAALAACLVRLGQPVQAWEHAESDLARGLLDDWLRPADDAAEAGPLARLGGLDQALLPLLFRSDLTAEERKRRDTLARERDTLLADLANAAARRARQRVLPLVEVQKQVPPDVALVFWLDVLDQHLGCVLRHEGEPTWVQLPGSGKDHAWAREDELLPDLAYRALLAEFLSEEEKQAILDRTRESDRPLVRRAFTPAERRRLQAALHRQRIAPLKPHLKGVRHLLVVPAGAMAQIPIEALTGDYTVSYVSSASLFARLSRQHRPLRGDSLLALGDPVFAVPKAVVPEPPAHGLLLKLVVPGGNAARAGLRPGDVLLAYSGKQLKAPADLVPSTGEGPVRASYWREGKEAEARLRPGPLGVAIDPRPAAEAVRAWRRADELLALRGTGHAPLPGSRWEVEALARLLGKDRSTLLLGSAASEQELDRLRQEDGGLKRFRLLHLATHGEVDWDVPARSALVLAQDKLPDPVEQARQGKKVYDGRLRVSAILDGWDLDADLVALSACQTGLGKSAGGEGLLGFAQAFLQKKARSVLLSRWKVDDTATALLMLRFYENALGKRKDLKAPLGRAAALEEAKAWLRGLGRAEAGRLAAGGWRLAAGGWPGRRRLAWHREGSAAAGQGRGAEAAGGRPPLRPPVLLGRLRPHRRPRLTQLPAHGGASGRLTANADYGRLDASRPPVCRIGGRIVARFGLSATASRGAPPGGCSSSSHAFASGGSSFPVTTCSD